MTTVDSRLDALAHAVSDATRRRIVEHLRANPGATTADVATLAPSMTRFAVMKHLQVLRRCGLVRSMDEGRRRRHFLEPVALEPLREWLGD
ncbi:MAG TPA: helix-turn-helix domain-containing protein [Candidatus Saccharimonadia bacterium]|nr:helix-turn-helix domain-containing protein [Candidatus Saccharimonadia bacterium]